jgi:hypothetical protein
MKKAQILRKEGNFFGGLAATFPFNGGYSQKKSILTHFFVAKSANRCNNIALNEPETRNVKPDY